MASISAMLLANTIVYASDATMMPTDPIPTTATYQYDAKAVSTLLSRSSSLFKVNCDINGVLQSLWYSAWKANLLSLWVLEWSYEYNADFRSCSLWINNRNANRNTNESISESEAIKKTDEFIAILKGKIYDKVGKPIIINKNQYGWVIMNAKDSMNVTAETESPINDVEIIEGDEEEVTREYTSYSILYPYTFNGLPVYNQRGQQVGITIDVNKQGILSANAQLLPRKWSRARSKKMTSEQMISFLNMWWNNPFYGNTPSVLLNKPERVHVIFTVPRGNTSDTYIGNGILLDSKTTLDQYSTQTYKMVVSDFAIGNNGQ